MPGPPRLIAAGLLPALLTGCAAFDRPTDPRSTSVADPRVQISECLRENGLAARDQGEREILIGSGPGSARVKFVATVGEGEAVQLRGESAGAEVIADAMLFVGQASEDDLATIEDCLEGRSTPDLR